MAFTIGTLYIITDVQTKNNGIKINNVPSIIIVFTETENLSFTNIYKTRDKLRIIKDKYLTPKAPPTSIIIAMRKNPYKNGNNLSFCLLF